MQQSIGIYCCKNYSIHGFTFYNMDPHTATYRIYFLEQRTLLPLHSNTCKKSFHPAVASGVPQPIKTIPNMPIE